jgi:hypothetical protein
LGFQNPGPKQSFDKLTKASFGVLRMEKGRARLSVLFIGFSLVLEAYA